MIYEMYVTGSTKSMESTVYAYGEAYHMFHVAVL